MPNPAPGNPLLLWLSVASTASFLPLFWLLDRFSGPCADGLCSSITGLFIAAGCLLISLALTTVGLLRGERPRWIPLLSLPLLAVMTVVLAL